MMEVEKKFDIPRTELLLAISGFIGNVIQDDVVYDDENFSLAKNNACLRQRNSKWELKLSNIGCNYRDVSIHDEIEGYDNICIALGETDLSRYHQVWHLITHRKKYKYQDFNLDLDHVESADNDFVYDLLEIELMVEKTSQCDAATERIMTLSEKYGLIEKNGKNLEYFRRYCR